MRDSKGPAAGTERGVCYPNGTCNEGLSCLSGLCVNAAGDVTSEQDGDPQDDLVANPELLQDQNNHQDHIGVDLSDMPGPFDVDDLGDDWDATPADLTELDSTEPDGSDIVEPPDLQETQDETPCTPACPASRCDNDDGCGGTCTCPDGQYCGHGFCVPDGYSYFHGLVQVTQVYTEFNNHQAEGKFTQVDGLPFEFIVFMNLHTVEQYTTPPFFEQEKMIKLHYDKAGIRIVGSGLGALGQLPGDINGAEGTMVLKSYETVNYLQDGNFDSQKSGKHLIFLIPQLLGPPAVLESGFPLVQNMPPVTTYGNIMSLDYDVGCWGDPYCDILDWTGQVSFNLPPI